MQEEDSASPRNTSKMTYELVSNERAWRDRQEMLERHGYLLRPRFRPGWVPSWLSTGEEPLLCEDSKYNLSPSFIDARRLSDNMRVAIKAAKRSSQESSIAKYFSSGDLGNDPTNHCVPVLDLVRDESFPTLEFIIMPLLRPFNDPPFYTVEETLDFMKQALEGLVFMHRVGVAHRDCSDNNIMFDAAGMYPKGFHASYSNLDASGKLAYPLRRSDVPSVRYYFTDFGISTRFEEGEMRLVRGMDGLDKDAPELSSFASYDPFPLDVFTLGNVFKRNFTLKYSNMEFLNPLVERMTQRRPSDRPSSFEALVQFRELVSFIPGYARRSRLKEVGKGKLASFVWGVGSVTRECYHILKSPFRISRNIMQLVGFNSAYVPHITYS